MIGICFFIASVIIFNISCFLHYRATISTLKGQNIHSFSFSKMYQTRTILIINLIAIIIFWIIEFISYVIFEITDAQAGMLIDRLFIISLGFVLIAFIVSMILFIKMNKDTFVHYHGFKRIICVALFPVGYYEYYMANYFKNMFPISNRNNRNIRAILLKKFNHYNLFTSSILVIIWYLLLCALNNYESFPLINAFVGVMTCIIGIRTCGRSIEIIYAFFKDVTNPVNKTSSLTNFDRMKLAIFSFLELLILYAGVYCLLDQPSLFNYIFFQRFPKDVIFDAHFIIISIINSFKTGTVVGADFILSADSIGKSFSGFLRDAMYGCFVTLHVLTNLVLTIFSISKYSSND